MPDLVLHRTCNRLRVLSIYNRKESIYHYSDGLASHLLDPATAYDFGVVEELNGSLLFSKTNSATLEHFQQIPALCKWKQTLAFRVLTKNQYIVLC